MRQKIKSTIRSKWSKRIGIFLGSVVVLIVALYAGLAWYVNTHKKEVLASVTAQLNENIDGELTIGNMEPTFLTGFPRISLRLEDVHLRDRQFSRHKVEFLKAGVVSVDVNALALLRGAIEIRKIRIRDAAVQLLTEKSGYSNTSVFKKSGKKSDGSSSSALLSPELRRLELEKVTFIAENKKASKRYHFDIAELTGDMEFSGDEISAELSLDAFARSMSFNIERGSFIQNQPLDGEFSIKVSADGTIALAERPLVIGKEKFTVSAKFKGADFDIFIQNPEIAWRKASALLAENISSRLDMFDFEQPISVNCRLDGNFDSTEDPLILVKATVRNNVLKTPGGPIANCRFDGTFTNNFDPKKGFNDANSAILFKKLKGDYGGVPFEMPDAAILDLENPYAKGSFVSAFDVPKLNGLVDPDFMKFTSGKADIKVNFTADVVNYKLAKPKVAGKIAIDSADIVYTQRKIKFDDVSIGLDFTDSDLFIRNIAINSGHSRVKMDGKVLNFLNLYYDAPEKILLEWNVYSPQLHIGEFMGYLGQRNKKPKTTKKAGNFTTELTDLFEKSNVRMAMKVDKLHYKSFVGTNMTSIIFLSDSLVTVQRTGLYHAGGKMFLSGKWSRKAVGNYSANATVENVDIGKFFKAFDDFGLESLKSDNLKGKFFVQANVAGKIKDDGTLVPKSMHGKVGFTLKNGSLVKFEPVKNVGKYAFPRRDMDNIQFAELHGDLDIRGEKVVVNPMKISSSVLNLDVAGVYSFGKGTKLNIDVPLRNPKDDAKLEKEEREKRRHRGVVIHLNAADDEKTGKVKIGLGKAE